MISTIQMITLSTMKMNAGIQKCRFLAFSLRSGAHFWQTIISFWSRHEQSLFLFLCSSQITAPQPFFLKRMRTSQRYSASFMQSGSEQGLTLNSGSSTRRCYSSPPPSAPSTTPPPATIPLISTSVPPSCRLIDEDDPIRFRCF